MTSLTRAGLKAYAARVRPSYESLAEAAGRDPDRLVRSRPARRRRAGCRGGGRADREPGRPGARREDGRPSARGRRVPGPEGRAHAHALQPSRRAAGRPRGRGLAHRALPPSPCATAATSGRGTTDDKGPALAALFGVAAAHQAGVPATVKLLWETEEEIGSPHFEATLRQARPRAWRPMPSSSPTAPGSRADDPRSTAGLRGFKGFRFTLETAEADAHSGIAGGAARNPLAELMDLACALHDARTGRVKVPGFYDGIVKPTQAGARGLPALGLHGARASAGQPRPPAAQRRTRSR